LLPLFLFSAFLSSVFFCSFSFSFSFSSSSSLFSFYSSFASYSSFLVPTFNILPTRVQQEGAQLTRAVQPLRVRACACGAVRHLEALLVGDRLELLLLEPPERVAELVAGPLPARRGKVADHGRQELVERPPAGFPSTIYTPLADTPSRRTPFSSESGFNIRTALQ